MKDIALKYYQAGLSVIPVASDKHPRLTDSSSDNYSWKKHQATLIKPNGQFDKSYGIGIVCGKVSGNLECIDIDLKYDLTGTLMARYKALISEKHKSILKNILVEQSPSGGYHFVYRCTTIGNNGPLARRAATPEEVEKAKSDGKKDEKVKVLIETRGEGGYFACAPTKGYTLRQMDFEHIPSISEEEREILISCAIALNEYVEYVAPRQKREITFEGISPFDSYNRGGDILGVLMEAGWSIAKENGINYFLKRPGKTESKWSATLRKKDNVFYVFSSSTEFDSSKAYSAAWVYAKIKHNMDWSATASDLIGQGFGERGVPKKAEAAPIGEPISFLASEEKIVDYINAAHDNTLDMGLPTGLPTLDKHLRFKRANFNVIGGHDNVGKTIVVLFLLMQSAKLHNWKWLIVSVENNPGYIFRKLMEFYLSKPISQMADTEVLLSARFVKAHFFIASNEESYSYKQVIEMGEKMKADKNIDGILLDPYNAVDFDETALRSFGDHNYHYMVTTEFRKFCKRTDTCLYLNCHAVTEALRRVWTKDLAPSTDLVGHPMPPKKSDVEGGGKFANRADDFIIIHRYTQHETLYRTTEIHVVKVKETETGGAQTKFGKPVQLQMNTSNCGFIEPTPKETAPVKKLHESKSEKKEREDKELFDNPAEF